MTAYAYLRRSSVSADSPGDASREAQEDAVRALAARHGDADLTILTDWGISGRKGADKRPGYRALLEAIEGGECSAVYSYSLSRLGRSLQELSRLIADCDRRGIPVRLHADNLDTSTASGRLLAHVLASVAQFESDVAGERVRAAQAARVARGERLGPPFFADAPTVLAAFDQAGSFSGAARLLNERGVPSQTGKPWWATTVAGIVRRHRHVANAGRGRRTVGSFLLSRLLRCPCGTLLTGSTFRGRVRYACARGAVLPHAKVTIVESAILPAIQAEVARLRPLPAVRTGMDDAQAIRDLEAERGRVLDMFQSGDIDRAERVDRLEGISERMSRLAAKSRLRKVPEVDWAWPAQQLNDVLRAVFDGIDLDPETFMPRPDGFAWVVPEWRAQYAGVLVRADR